MHLLPMREDVFAILDVAPGSVHASLASLSRGAIHILATCDSLMTIESETPEHSVAAIGERIDDCAKRLMEKAAQKHIKSRITKVFCVVHAPWTRSATDRKRVDYERETRIHESHIGAIAKELLGTITGVDTKAIMEAAVIRTWLNGYPIVEPEGKNAHSLVVCALISDLDSTVRKNTESAIQRAFPVATVEWRSAARSMQTVLGSIYRHDENYLAVDIGMDYTHIISVRDAFPAGQRVIPIGLRSMLTKIDPKRSPEETLGLIRMLLHDACEGSACDAIQQAMAAAEPEFVKTFGEAFGALAAERRLANTLVLSAHPDMAEWMKQLFSRLDFTQFTVTTLPFTVIPFDTTLQGNTVTSEEQIDAHVLFDAALVNTDERA